MGVIDSVSLSRSEGEANYMMEVSFPITHHLKFLNPELRFSLSGFHSLEIFLGAISTLYKNFHLLK